MKVAKTVKKGPNSYTLPAGHPITVHAHLGAKKRLIKAKWNGPQSFWFTCAHDEVHPKEEETPAKLAHEETESPRGHLQELSSDPNFHAFSKQISANRDARLPAMVAADWLEENGHHELSPIYRRHHATNALIGSGALRPVEDPEDDDYGYDPRQDGPTPRVLASSFDFAGPQNSPPSLSSEVRYAPFHTNDGRIVHGVAVRHWSTGLFQPHLGGGHEVHAPVTKRELAAIIKKYRHAGPRKTDYGREQRALGVASSRVPGIVGIDEVPQVAEQLARKKEEEPLATVYASPSTREDSTLEHATGNYLSDPHKALLQLAVKLGAKNVRPAIGVWTDGAEESTASEVPASKAELLGAALGHRGNQKSVMTFTPRKNGDSVRFIVKYPAADFNRVVNTFNQEGIDFHTHFPSSRAQGAAEESHVVLERPKVDAGMLDAIHRAAGKLGGIVRAEEGDGKFIGADDRLAARKIFSEILHRHVTKGASQVS